MAKTIVIKNADFSTNAVEKVTLITETIPCTGITLDNDSLSIVTTGNTGSLVATPAPSDTTDSVVWTSSDSDVATVSGGIVTATGVGSATITATCGSYSASATVTVTETMNKSNLLKMSGVYAAGNPATESGNGKVSINTNANRGTLASATGTKYCNEYNGGYFYPYIMPKGTKRVKITDTGSTGIKKQNLLWFNSQTPASELEPDFVQFIGTTALSSISDNPYIVDVPTYQGYPDIDSMVIVFRTYKSGTTFVDADFSDVTVEFLPEAEE